MSDLVPLSHAAAKLVRDHGFDPGLASTVALLVIETAEEVGYVLVPAEKLDGPHECVYSGVYHEAIRALDQLLGPKETDGCGRGLLDDIYHLAKRCEHFPDETGGAG